MTTTSTPTRTEEKVALRPAVPRALAITRDVLASIRDAFIIAFFVAMIVFGGTILHAVSTAGTGGGSTSDLPQPSPWPSCLGEEPC